jgi:lipopolysaccharide export system protein LptA
MNSFDYQPQSSKRLPQKRNAKRLSFFIFHFSFFILGFLSKPFDCFSQTKTKEVEIINADFLKMQEVEGKKFTYLVGNVALKQDEMLMWCDSAILDKETNSVDAFGRVHIQQDTVDSYSNYLKYDGNSKFATLRGKARLSNKSMNLYTEELFYDSKNKVSYYLNDGKVVKDSTVITSKKGYYYKSSNEVFFNDSVVIVDPNYNLTSDTLKYNTTSKVSTFFGNTIIINKNSRIECNNGWYDSQHDVSSFGMNTVVVNPPQRLVGDSLYYERFRGFGKAIGNFVWVDSSMETEIHGQYGEFIDSQQFIMATQKPLLIHKMDKDSLFLTADTLKSMNKSKQDTVKFFYAYHKARMFMKDMQGVCDSLFYSFEDSTFRMYYDPVIWSDNIQISGDTAFLHTKNKKADKFEIYKSGFIISPSGTKYFDQIKGINIFGYFEDNEMRKVDVIGNAESLYFGKDERDKYVGNNKALSVNIAIYFKEKKIDKIVFIKKPEAVFTPMKMLTKEQYHLKDFKWQIERKPKSREELMQ